MQSWVVSQQPRPPPPPRGSRRQPNPSALPPWPPGSCLCTQQVTEPWLFLHTGSPGLFCQETNHGNARIRQRSNYLLLVHTHTLSCEFCNVTPSWVDSWSQGSCYVKQDTQKQWINWYRIASFRCAVKRINNEAGCWNIQLLWHLPFIFHF